MTERDVVIGASSPDNLLSDFSSILASSPGWIPVFKRYFLSSAGQAAEFPRESGAVSYVVQPPLGGYGVGLWAHLVCGDVAVDSSEGLTLVRDGELEHMWSAGMISSAAGSEAQTAEILSSYEAFLSRRGLDIADHCVRTWFFCSDIDNNYAGLVKARRENFALHKLLPETHYIASTGIGGSPVAGASLVQMDAYALRGNYGTTFLYAPTHLNPTYEYGVTFERATVISTPGSRRCFISGTASIDNKGAVLHVGDVKAQTLRMWENVEALLSEAGMGWNNVSMALVYLRNVSDYESVAPLFASKFAGLPMIFLHAPVCRPDWLIEMECIGAVEKK